MIRSQLSVVSLLLVAGVCLLPQSLVAKSAPKSAQDKPFDPYQALTLRQIGPAVGGRITSVTGVIQDSNVFYAAAAQGGVWKSTNGGLNWEPIFDDQDTQSIGAIAVAPSDPNVLYVGSGEANIRGNVAIGYGIWKSNDAGKSFAQVLKLKGQIGQIEVDPKNPDHALAAVLGSPFGANAERGIYRTIDGGKTWNKTLYKDADTGASDVAINPQNPRIVFAGLWQTRRQPWTMTSGGPGSGLYRSTDSGQSFEEIEGSGLPEKPYGKIGVAVAPSDGNRVYALIEAKDGGLFRSNDGGESFSRVNAHRVLRQRAWYYSTLVVDPHNADVIWFPQVRMLKSTDAGKTITGTRGYSHGDHHDIWLDPNHPKRMIVGHDGGINVSHDGGKSWFHPTLALAQFYNIDVDNRKPYHVGGTMQDMGTASGPSAALRSSGVALSDWRYAGGGEAGDFVYDPFQPGVVYAGEYSGFLSHYDEATGQVRTISPYLANGSGVAPANLKYRFQWTSPTIASAHTKGVIYHAGNALFKSTDHGASFTPISPDLTRNDKSKQGWSGGPITGDITTVETYDTIFSLAESPVQAGLIWAGSDDGLVHLTRDDGKNWSEVTPNGLPQWATIEGIQADPKDAASAYLVAHNYRLDDHAPYLFHTSNYGQSWSRLAKNLPNDLTLWSVRVDPADLNVVYLGTQRGLWFSTDRGQQFQQLKSNLPNIAVTDIETKHGDLIIGTRGRSIWVLENLANLRAVAAVQKQKLAFLPAKSGTRVAADNLHQSFNNGEQSNADFGVRGYYYLSDKIERPAQSKAPLVRLEITDSTGRIVKTMTDVAKPNRYLPDDPDEPEKANEAELGTSRGLNAFIWNLSTNGAKRLQNAKFDFGDAEDGPMALPGQYTLKLTALGQTMTQTVQVLPDPRSNVSAEDLQANHDLAMAALSDLNRAVDLINSVRSLRSQLNSQVKALQAKANTADAITAANILRAELVSIENLLHNPSAKVVYDILAGRDGGAKLFHQLAPLYYGIISTEHKPTQAMQERHVELRAELAKVDQRYRQMLQNQKASFDTSAKAFGGGLIAVVQ